ncbi:MAG: hypothetical protein V4850_08580 [Myxococcota bacterium]
MMSSTALVPGAIRATSVGTPGVCRSPNEVTVAMVCPLGRRPCDCFTLLVTTAKPSRTKDECSAHIARVWTDMRPARLRGAEAGFLPKAVDPGEDRKEASCDDKLPSPQCSSS